jgi:hypothetical protein
MAGKGWKIQEIIFHKWVDYPFSSDMFRVSDYGRLSPSGVFYSVTEGFSFCSSAERARTVENAFCCLF